MFGAGVFEKYGLFRSDWELYKLYILTENAEGVKEYKDLLLNLYGISESKLNILQMDALG